jgi:hypothetical protein
MKIIKFFDKTFGEPWSGILLISLSLCFAGVTIYVIAVEADKNNQIVFKHRLNAAKHH